MSDFESFDLDQVTARAWTQLQDRLAEHLADMDEDETLVIDVEGNDDGESDGAYPYVQFAVGEEDILLEVSSNEFLATLHQLGVHDEKALVMMGLTPPGEPDPDGDTSPNFHLTAPRGHAPRVAVLAVQALRDVLSVPHPAFLRTDALYPDTDLTPEDVPDEEATVAVVPRNRTHLQELVDRALVPVFGHPPEHDDDGDVPAVHGSALVFIRVLEHVPVVRLFATVVDDVVDLDRAAFEVSVLNRDSGFIRYVLVEQRVMSFLDVPAYPFVPLHLRAMLETMSEAVDAVDDDLAVRVGGRPAYEGADGGGRHESGRALVSPAAETGDDLHPAMQTLLELDAEGPGSIDPELAAHICGQDRELVLALIKENSEQEIAWREHRDQALVAVDEEEAEAAEHEMRNAERMVSLLRRSLRLIVTAQRTDEQAGRHTSPSRYRPSNAADEAPMLFDRDGL